MLEFTTLVLFPLLMAYAAASDLLTMKISNWVSIALVLGFVVLALVTGLPAAVWFGDHLSCGMAVLVLTFVLFAFGWIGGGDAKLAAATAVWLGWDNLFDYGLEASLIGAILTLAILYWRKMALPQGLAHRAWINRLHAAGNGVPYGIALSISGLLLYPTSTVWMQVAASLK